MSTDMKEVMKKAASLFAEYKEGDEFERLYNDHDPNNYQTIPPEQVVEMLQNGYRVRIKPKPVRRLKATWEIVKEAERLGRLTVSKMGQVFIGDSSLWNVIDCNDPNSDLYGIEVKDWPDWFFTTEPPTPPVDRIVEMSNSVADKYLLSNGSKLLATVIREECASRGIT